MFDIGFTEILIVAVLSLIILGPERLPEAVKTLALWIGRFKRSYRQIRQDIEHEIGAEDIRRQLYNEEILESLKKSEEELSSIKEESQSVIGTLNQRSPTDKKPSTSTNMSE